MRQAKTTERYVSNVGFYLATWAEALEGRDLCTVTLQELLRELARHKTVARGEGKVAVFEDQGDIAATITFIYKSGNVHRQSIDR